MPVHGVSGIPGHGKTSLMMEALAAAAALNAKHVLSGKHQIVVNGVKLIERPLYACGIDGLQDGLCGILENPTQWQDLPDGSLVFVDEAWKWFGHQDDARGAKPPAHVTGFAEHRHRGMDFWMTFQSPKQLYPFLRPLVGPHSHVVRRFGSQLIDVYTWGELVEDVQSQGYRDRAVKVTRTLPTKQRSLYKSASAHTIKTRIPLKMIAALVCVVLAVPVIVMTVKHLRPKAITAGVTGAPDAGLPADGAATTGKNPKAPMTVDEYVAQFVPRVAGVHGSEPIFDGREVQAQPATYCISSQDGVNSSCHCLSEQGTPVRDIQAATCLEWARNGRYDPYKAAPVAAVSRAEYVPETALPLDLDAPHLGGIAKGSPLQVGAPGMGTVQGGAP